MTCHVDNRGTPLVRPLPGGLTLTKVSVGPMDNNAYLLSQADEVLLIDAANDASTLLELIGERSCRSIVTTHRHHDHIQALAQVASATGATVYAGRPDAEAIEAATGVGVEPLWDGDTVGLADATFEVIGLVGHTPGSIALAYEAGDRVALFTGDSLFPGGVGKTGTSHDFASLLDDVTSKLFDRFGDDTVVHPGHGDATTLGRERPHLDEWRERGW